MTKNRMRGAKGISLVSLAIAVVVLMILANIIIYNTRDSLKVGNLKEMQTDIENLRDKISSYYAQNGKIPAKLEYMNINHLKTAGVISEAVDTGKFLVIDLSALENLTLNRGKDYEAIKDYEILRDEQAGNYTDLYIINETSHNIFYVAGVKVDHDTYYTDYAEDEIDTVAVNLRYVENVKIPDGFYYVGGTKETGIVISDIQGDDLNNTKGGNQFVWVPVPNIKDFHLIRGYSEGNLDSIENAIEPNNNGYSTEVAEYEAMKKSVEVNQGFYIGRFEAGKENDKVVVKKDKPAYTNVKWGNSMTDSTGGAVELSKNFTADKSCKNSVTSTLCYGVQWDATMQFFDSNYIKGECDENSYVRNSNGKGNYGTGNSINTGSNDEYKVKNIYDMAGNVREWTMEANGTTTRVFRGSYYDSDYNGANNPVSERANRNPDGGYTDIGFRIALYLNVEEKWSLPYDKEGIYEDRNGDTAYVPKGFSVSETNGENTIDTGLVVKDSNNNEWVWIEVPKTTEVYKTAELNIKDFTDEEYAKIEKDLQNYVSSYRKRNYTDTWYSKEQHGFQSVEEYNAHKKSMLKSVYQNGGFYIGRYEVGTNTIRKAGTDSLTTPLIQRDVYPYNYVTCSQAQTLAKQLQTEEKTSSLMFGIQWDLVLKFIEVKGGKTQKELKEDSVEWGNYENAKFVVARGKYSNDYGINYLEVEGNYEKVENKDILLTTGATDRNSTLGIYDLAGNIWEWTLEYSTDTNYPCVYRGGVFDYESFTFPVVEYSSRSISDSLNTTGFRSVLW